MACLAIGNITPLIGKIKAGAANVIRIMNGAVQVWPCLECNPDSQVLIGTQRWTLCNLNVTTYSDGTPIPEAASDMDWWLAPFGAWCHVNGDPANDAIYGKLYNSNAMEGIWDQESRDDPDFRLSLAPDGYHIPNAGEWQQLFASFGTTNGVIVGNKLKEIGFQHWNANNTGGNNQSGFTALGAGWRVQNNPGGYFDFLASTKYWSSTPVLGSFYSAFNIFSVNQAAGLFSENGTPSRAYVGCSVRLIKNINTFYINSSATYCFNGGCVLTDPITQNVEVYSGDSVLVTGSYIYTDIALTIPYTTGPFIDNDTYIFSVNSLGQLTILCTKYSTC